MNPEHVAEQLLAHGALDRDAFLRITGWRWEKAEATLNALAQRGVVTILRSRGVHTQVYWLTRNLPSDRTAGIVDAAELRPRPPKHHKRVPARSRD